MFGKVKKILGIEGVKLQLIIPDKVNKNAGLLQGIVKLTALSDNNVVEEIEIIMIEKYTRGRKENQLIDEYPMGKSIMRQRLNISRNDVLEIPFELNFQYAQSEMDKIADRGIISKAIVGLAKKLKGVKSEFYVKAEAKIKGTTLNPFDKVTVNLF
jgi:hypothetical protein